MGKKKLDHLKFNYINPHIELALKWLAKSGIQNNNKNILAEYGAFNAWYDTKSKKIFLYVFRNYRIFNYINDFSLSYDKKIKYF